MKIKETKSSGACWQLKISAFSMQTPMHACGANLVLLALTLLTDVKDDDGLQFHFPQATATHKNKTVPMNIN